MLSEARARCARSTLESPDYAECAVRIGCLEDGIARASLNQCIEQRIYAKEKEVESARAQLRARQAAQDRTNQKLDKVLRETIRTTFVAPRDPRDIFIVGSRWESDALNKTLEGFPEAASFFDQSSRVTFSGKSYLIQTRKLNDTDIPAIYEIVSVINVRNDYKPSRGSSNAPTTSEQSITCEELTAFAKADSRGFIERSVLVGNARRQGLCK